MSFSMMFDILKKKEKNEIVRKSYLYKILLNKIRDKKLMWLINGRKK